MHDSTDSEETESLERSPVIRVVIRPWIPEQDQPFIYASWRNAMWFAEDRDDRQSERFFSAATREIRKILQAKGTEIRIAIVDGDPNHIVGYSVCNGTHLYWVYVKADYRNSGIARLLCMGSETFSEPVTKYGKAIVASKNLKVVK